MISMNSNMHVLVKPLKPQASRQGALFSARRIPPCQTPAALRSLPWHSGPPVKLPARSQLNTACPLTLRVLAHQRLCREPASPVVACSSVPRSLGHRLSGRGDSEEVGLEAGGPTSDLHMLGGASPSSELLTVRFLLQGWGGAESGWVCKSRGSCGFRPCLSLSATSLGLPSARGSHSSPALALPLGESLGSHRRFSGSCRLQLKGVVGLQAGDSSLGKRPVPLARAWLVCSLAGRRKSTVVSSAPSVLPPSGPRGDTEPRL